jgi:hypothetical protein
MAYQATEKLLTVLENKYHLPELAGLFYPQIDADVRRF